MLSKGGFHSSQVFGVGGGGELERRLKQNAFGKE